MGRVAAPLTGLRLDLPYAEAGRRVVDVRSRELFSHVDGVLDANEPERVHQMRVATRRLRASLEVFADAFPAKAHRAVLAEVKALAAALGERRDCDVQLEILDELRASASRSERDAIDELLAELRHEQRAANRHLKKALAHAEREDLETRLRRLSR
jgi:CHAD domain-containing protein